MCGKIFTILVLAVAIIMGILAIALPLDKLHDFIVMMRFVESTIPVLAVGALIKYISSGWDFK